MEHLQRRHRFSYDTFVVCVSSPLEYSLVTLKPQLFYIATTVRSHPCRWYHETNWIIGKSKEETAFFSVLIWCCVNQYGCCSKRISVPFVHRIMMLMKMIWWHRFWCALWGINEPTRRLTVNPSFREGEMPSVLALGPVHPKMNSGIQKCGTLLNPYLSFKSCFDISVPLGLLLTWSMPFNPVSLIFLLASHKA